MPQKSENRPEADLIIEQISLIGMNALLGMSVRAETGLTGDSLRYDTGIDGLKGNLGMLDLIAIMEPHAQRAIASRDVRIGGDVVAGDRQVFHVEMEASRIFRLLGKGSIPAVHEFIGCFFVEIRRIICKNKKSSQSLGHTTTGALAALAAWVVESFHVASPVATAVAAGVLVAAMTASKAAFCKMTEAQAALMFPKPAVKPKKKSR